MRDYALEEHDVKLLTLACECWDRGVQARQALQLNGLTFNDRLGQPKPRPEIAVERDSRMGFARLLRELSLSVAEPTESRRLPSLRSNRG